MSCRNSRRPPIPPFTFKGVNGFPGYDYATVQIGDQCWFFNNTTNGPINATLHRIAMRGAIPPLNTIRILLDANHAIGTESDPLVVHQ